MRESLDKVGKSRENFVEEFKTNDGSRYAQIKVAGKYFLRPGKARSDKF